MADEHLESSGVHGKARGLPTVSALICAYNYEQYIGRALESALAQDYPAELLEIVVIDDGSTDSTGDIVDEIAERNPGRVRVVYQVRGPSREGHTYVIGIQARCLNRSITSSAGRSQGHGE